MCANNNNRGYVGVGVGVGVANEIGGWRSALTDRQAVVIGAQRKASS